MPLSSHTTTAASSWRRWIPSLQATLTFTRGWLGRPTEVASAVPSSHVLEQRMATLVQQRDPSFVIELGPGTGGTTRALLNCLRDDAQLLAIEFLPEFADQLRAIEDPRLRVVQSDAANLKDILSQENLGPADVVVSGVPFSTMEPATARSIVEQIYTALWPGGSFVAYQFRDTISRYTKDFFAAAEVSYVLWNLPPLRLYRWQKNP